MGAAENFWGKYGGDGQVSAFAAAEEVEEGAAAAATTATTATAAAAAPAANTTGEAATAPSSRALYWWKFTDTDCSGVDLPGTCPGTPDSVACCTGQTVEQCKATCQKTPGCGGFNYPHGILKGTRCYANKAASSTTLYLVEDTPQPPPPPPPQWTGHWALNDRYNYFLCHLRNYGVVAPPSMPSYCSGPASRTEL
jgi:hypothetical protein